LTLLKYFPPLVLDVPVRKTKEGYKVETRTVMLRREECGMIENQKIKVYGMMCSHCENTVATELNKLPGVKDAVASFKDEVVSFTLDTDKSTFADIEAIILDNDYSLEPPEAKALPEGPPREEDLSLEPSQPGADTVLELEPEPEPELESDQDNFSEISFNIEGMTCANCSLAIEKAFKRTKGVRTTSINLPLNKGFVTYDQRVLDDAGILDVVKQAGYSATLNKAGGYPSGKETGQASAARERFRFLFALVFTVPMVVLMHFGPFGMAVTNSILFVLASLVQFVSGRAFYEGAYYSLKNRVANMDVLISLGISAAYFYSVFSLFFIDASKPVFFDSSAMLITFIMIGKMLEANAKGKTGQALKELLALNPDEARVVRNGLEEMIHPSLVEKGDVVKVLAGEKIPVDGEVLEGETQVDESMLTGESFPVHKAPGGKVIGATINQSGTITVKTTKTGNDTVLAGIVKMVEDAQADKAPIQRLADTISNVFVPIVVAVALATFFYWYFLGVLGADTDTTPFLFSFERMIAVLVIACPCALGLATPTAIMVGTGVGLNRGILFKKGSVLENISHLDVVLFDKTGTITRGKPEVSDIFPAEGMTRDDFLKLAVSAEINSSHPLAKSVVTFARESGVEPEKTTRAQEVSGFGVQCLLNGKELKAGNLKLIKGADLSPEMESKGKMLAEQGKTTVYIALDNRVVGIFSLSDVIKPDSKEAVERLHRAGIRTALVSGDNLTSALAVAKQVGIDEVEAEVLPQDKINTVKKWQAKGLKVAMVGDGINDAPALAQADIGIAIGSGTDVAKETGDVILVKNNLLDVERAIRLGKKSLKTIKMNFFWAFFYNLLMIPIAAGILYPGYGLTLKPEFASIAMWMSSLSVVGNSLLLKRFEKKMMD